MAHALFSAAAATPHGDGTSTASREDRGKRLWGERVTGQGVEGKKNKPDAADATFDPAQVLAKEAGAAGQTPSGQGRAADGAGGAVSAVRDRGIHGGARAF